MKLHVVLSLVVLAGYVQMSVSCCRTGNQSHQCNLRKKIGIIRAALKQASCARTTTGNICECHKEAVCPTKPLECAPVKPPACPTSPRCPSIPANPCSCHEKTPLCPFVPVKPCACHRCSGCPITQKPCVEKQCAIRTPVCPAATEKSCACPPDPVHRITESPCVDKTPLCLPIPVKVPPCQENTPACPVHVEKPCDCRVRPPVCPAVTEKFCAPSQTVTEKKPCHCPESCCHHVVIPVASVSNIFANSKCLGIPSKQHVPDCVKPTTTTTCAPPEPACYVCIPCKSKQCKEIMNKVKLHVTGGKEPCMVCDE